MIVTKFDGYVVRSSFKTQIAPFFVSLLCVFASLFGDDFYDVPKGCTPITACHANEILAFLEKFQKCEALMGENIILSKRDGRTMIYGFHDFGVHYEHLVLFETGEMECYWNNEVVPGEGTYHLYKGNFQNDGHLCYMLVCNNSGSGNYDWVSGVWKVIDERIDRLNMNEDLAKAFFPGHDAHLFYGHHAEPFLIEKEGKVFMRWVDGYFPRFIKEHDDVGPSSMYTYCWAGNTFHYMPSLSKGDNPIVGPEKRLQEYMLRFYECQKKAISSDSEEVNSVNFENLKEFIHLQSKSDKADRYPSLHLSKEGYFALKNDSNDETWWVALRLQSDVSLESENYDKYILYRGDFFNEDRDVFILIKTYNSLMFHDWEDTIWAWEVSKGKLNRIALKPPTPWIAHPFITKEKGKYRLHFVVKCGTSHDDSSLINFQPSLITHEFQGKNKFIQK